MSSFDAFLRRRHSLRLELLATLALVLGMAVVSLSLTAEFLGQQRHHEQETQRLRDHARGLAALAAREFSGESYGREPVRQLLHQSGTQLGATVELYRVRDGVAERLEAAGILEDSGPPPTGEARVDDALLDRYALIIVDEPVPTFGGKAVIVLRILAEPSPWTRSHDWPETLMVAVGVAGILSLLGGLMLELLVFRPLRNVERAAAAVAAGNLDARADEDGPTELSKMATSFNEMTASLQGQRERLDAQQTQLQRSERLAAVGRLAAGVAHEVGNPLAAIHGYTDVLLGGSDDEAERKEVLQRIHGQTTRIQNIVGQLLEYSRPAPLNLQHLDPVEVSRRVVELFRADPHASGIAFTVEGEPELCVHADEGRIQQVLLNLLINASRAIKAAGVEVGRVRVRVRGPAEDLAESADARVSIEVHDNGPGVPDEVRARIFEPFFTTRKAGEGTGLGLAISADVAESMNGSLSCLAAGARPPIVSGEAAGAVFRLTLPSHRARPSDARAPSEDT